jgi:hypothetical protein
LKSALLPIAEFAGFGFINKVKRLIDRRFGCDPEMTRKKSVYDYTNLYCGPVYLIHFRYAGLLILLNIVLLYGNTLPILFPIALLGYCVLWVIERIQIAYYYRQPPAYDT